MSIEESHKRFKDIIKGKLRDDLKDFVRRGDRIIQKGKNKYTVSMPEIDMPKFIFGSNDGQGSQGMGQGDGPPQQGQPGDQPGQGNKAGDGEGEKAEDSGVELSSDELAEILQEELELPNIEPKGEQKILETINKYKTIGTKGPNSLIDRKRTYKEALKRSIATKQYNPKKPVIVPIKEDKRFRQAVPQIVETNSAVVIYMMDVSGSMGEEQKEIARNMCFWINLWIQHEYKNVTTKYLIHDSTALEVNEERFFNTRESGGTRISSVYELGQELITGKFLNQNIYVFQISDGDVWDKKDSDDCVRMLQDFYLPVCNLFCYAQTNTYRRGGEFFQAIQSLDFDNLLNAEINKRSDILDAIKVFLGKGQ